MALAVAVAMVVAVVAEGRQSICRGRKGRIFSQGYMACLDYRLASLIACLELSAGASFGLLLSEG